MRLIFYSNNRSEHLSDIQSSSIELGFCELFSNLSSKGRKFFQNDDIKVHRMIEDESYRLLTRATLEDSLSLLVREPE